VRSPKEPEESAHLIAVAYESERDATLALEAMRKLADEQGLALKDAAVVLKTADEHVELRQTRQHAVGDSVVGGGTIGLLVGLVLGVPIAGALAGLGGGGAVAAFDRGISDDRMRRFGAELEPGHAALFALVADVADWLRLYDLIAPYGGEVAVSQLDAAVIAALGADSAGP
jgi:uncharacterized membrane protein